MSFLVIYIYKYLLFTCASQIQNNFFTNIFPIAFPNEWFANHFSYFLRVIFITISRMGGFITPKPYLPTPLTLPVYSSNLIKWVPAFGMFSWGFCHVLHIRLRHKMPVYVLRWLAVVSDTFDLVENYIRPADTNTIHTRALHMPTSLHHTSATIWAMYAM